LKALAQKDARTRWLTERIASLISAGNSKSKRTKTQARFKACKMSSEPPEVIGKKAEEDNVFSMDKCLNG
jgi:hypothetical protein